MRYVALLLCGLATITGVSTARGETLESRELAQLGQYLTVLKSGGLGSAAQVDTLADVSYPGLEQIVSSYAALPEPIEGHSHRAWQTLLERTSRSALHPWPMIELYSPQLGQFLTRPIEKSRLSQRLLARLLASGGDRRSYDLAVRLTPGPALDYLATGPRDHRAELLEAWNRRLARAQERRPIAGLERFQQQIAAQFTVDLPQTERVALLKFMGYWPALAPAYRSALEICLKSQQVEVVLDGLAAQQERSGLLELNEAIVRRFPRDEKVLEAALRNYGGDATHDYSAVLRGLWSLFTREQVRTRYHLLLAMNAHPRGNEDLALAAVLEQPFELLDVAIPVLAAGNQETARKAVEFILTQSHRGHEEAFRLATRLKMTGFAAQAVAIAGDASRDQILRQAALLYLSAANGATRQRFVPYLDHTSADLRLTTIQMFANPSGLTTADKDAIGPALIRVALTDRSMGHRQEAIYALGQWREPQTEPLYRKLLVDYPKLAAVDGVLDPEQYWPYRLRLVSLLALAKLGDQPARAEMLELHRTGGPAERMDVLLAFAGLNEAPAVALEDLRSTDPKLVATATDLIARFGDQATQAAMRTLFARSPLWQEFRGSGLDDHNVLRLSGTGDKEVRNAP